MIEGSIDVVAVNRIAGWLGDRSSEAQMSVTATLYGAFLGEAPAVLYRPDLEAVGFGSGLCGFEIPLHTPLNDVDLPYVIVRPTGSSLTIPRTAESTYRDITHSLLAQFPSCGRSRSIFGGLWTDRTDSIYLVGSRAINYAFPEPVKDALVPFVSDGFCSISIPDRPVWSDKYLSTVHSILSVEEPDRRELGDAVKSLINAVISDPVAEFLRFVLDDVPVLYSASKVNEAHFMQAPQLESFTSPAEVVVVYAAGPDRGAQLQYLVGSHELPEFGPTGKSRWTVEGRSDIPLAAASQSAVNSTEISSISDVVVGPGLIHRVVSWPGARATRFVFAPKRVSPSRFASTEATWNEFDVGRGLRARL